MIKVGDLLQPVAKLVGDVTRDLHKLVDPKVAFITMMVVEVVLVLVMMMVMVRQNMLRLVLGVTKVIIALISPMHRTFNIIIISIKMPNS